MVQKNGKLFVKYYIFSYICNMKNKDKHIGKITKLDYIKSNRKASREIELEIMGGWISRHKVHKSKKSYNRKLKHKKILISQ